MMRRRKTMRKVKQKTKEEEEDGERNICIFYMYKTIIE